MYNAKGQRTKKGDIQFYYDSQGRLIRQSGFEFYYDITGLIGFKTRGANYIYRKDAQGNIIAIIDRNGTAVVEYDYDAWGNMTVSGSNVTLGNLNPFRYRGYYYDTETKLYYLQPRYYDPETGRFLNMDSIDYADPESLNGLNLYAYCNNNPVMYVDPTGHAWWHWALGALIVAALVVATCVSAGSLAGGLVALTAAAYGTSAIGASVVTTTLAFASIGAGVTFAASSIVAGIDALDVGVNTHSIDNAFKTFFDYGETAMWSTLSSGVIYGVVGYFSHVDYSERTDSKSHPFGTTYNTRYKTITHYDLDGNMWWSKHLTDHGQPARHSVPHWHLENPHRAQFDSKFKLLIELLKTIF